MSCTGVAETLEFGAYELSRAGDERLDRFDGLRRESVTGPAVVVQDLPRPFDGVGDGDGHEPRRRGGGGGGLRCAFVAAARTTSRPSA